MKKLLCFIFLLSAVLIGGCKNMKEKNGESIVLNDRQIEILRKERLPEEYDKLNSSQKKSIISIEEMLSEVEEKYNEEFIYYGYISESQIETETLYVYPNNGTYETDLFYVKRKKIGNSYNYEDNYISILIRKDYEEYIKDFFVDKYKLNETKVYSDISEVNLDKEDISKENIDGNVISRNMIFISIDNNKDDYSNVADEYQNWIEQHDIKGLNQLIFIRYDDWKKVTKYNYSDFLDKDSVVLRIDCDNN